MLGSRAQRLIGRTLAAAAITGAIVVLVLIYVRSGGAGNGAGTLALSSANANAKQGGGGGPANGSAGGESAGSGGPPTAPEAGEQGGGGQAAGESAAGGPPLRSGVNGATGTYTGSVIQTIYGPVQVAVTEQGGQITEVKALQVPTEHAQSLYISERVTPMLRSEVLQAQSAEIAIVSGATFTSEGYAASLQKALSHVH